MEGCVRRRQRRQVRAVNMVCGAPEGDCLFGHEIPHLAGKERDGPVQEKAGAEDERVPDGCRQPLGRNPPVRRDGPREAIWNV